MFGRLTQICFFCLMAIFAIQAQSLNAATLTAQGVEALKSNQPDEAEKLFQQALRQKPTGELLALIHHNLGVIRQQRGAHAEAAAEFRLALQAQPVFGQSHLQLGISFLALNKNIEAVAAFERAVRFLPTDEQARRQLARACERAENWLCVVEQYQTLSEMKPLESEYSYQLGRAYSRLSEWSYQRIIAINPDAARLHQALGQQYLTQGRYDLAVAEYRRASQVDPQLPEIHLAMAVIYLEQKNYDAAGKEIELELRIAPQSLKALEVKRQIEAAKPR